MYNDREIMLHFSGGFNLHRDTMLAVKRKWRQVSAICVCVYNNNKKITKIKKNKNTYVNC